MKYLKTIYIVLILTLSLFSVNSQANDADSHLALIQKADQAYSEGRYRQALNYYQHASANTADRQTHYLKIARCFQRLGIHKSALAVTTEILNDDPNQVDALLIKGEVTEAQNNYEDALLIYQQIEQLDPGNNAMYHAQASVLRQMGREKDAAEALKKIKQ